MNATAVARPSPPEIGERWNLSPGKCGPFQGQTQVQGMGCIP